MLLHSSKLYLFLLIEVLYPLAHTNTYSRLPTTAKNRFEIAGFSCTSYSTCAIMTIYYACEHDHSTLKWYMKHSIDVKVCALLGVISHYDIFISYEIIA